MGSQKVAEWTCGLRMICLCHNNKIKNNDYPILSYKMLVRKIQKFQEKTQKRDSHPLSVIVKLNLSVLFVVPWDVGY